MKHLPSIRAAISAAALSRASLCASLRASLRALSLCAIITAALSSCTADDPAATAPTAVTESSASGKSVTFAIAGDFTLSTAPMTRALTADGRDLTDVWLLDYDPDGTILQSLHQTSDDDDFGTPTVTLALGTHYIYIVASRGQSPTLNTSTKTITFAKVLDTFWQSLTLDITTGGTESRPVTLDRAVTKLRLFFTDPVPEGVATINITPGTWYYGINYQTGAPTAAQTNEPIILNVPAASVGSTTESANVYGFSATTEWTTAITVVSYDTDDNIIGSANIPAAPFLRNRVSEYTGTLWTLGSGMALSLNTAWLTSHTDTW